LFGPFFVNWASGFSLCLAYIALHNRDREVSLVGVGVVGVGMNIALNVVLAVVVLYGLTVIFIRLREEYRRNLPRQEL
jgi:hypothetical protein